MPPPNTRPQSRGSGCRSAAAAEVTGGNLNLLSPQRARLKAPRLPSFDGQKLFVRTSGRTSARSSRSGSGFPSTLPALQPTHVISGDIYCSGRGPLADVLVAIEPQITSKPVVEVGAVERPARRSDGSTLEAEPAGAGPRATCPIRQIQTPRRRVLVGGRTRTLIRRSRLGAGAPCCCSGQNGVRPAGRSGVASRYVLRMGAGALWVRSMAGGDSTNRLGEGTVDAPPGGIDYVYVLPGCCQRPRHGGRSGRRGFGHLRRSVFGGPGLTWGWLAWCPNIIGAGAAVRGKVLNGVVLPAGVAGPVQRPKASWLPGKRPSRGVTSPLRWPPPRAATRTGQAENLGRFISRPLGALLIG